MDLEAKLINMPSYVKRYLGLCSGKEKIAGMFSNLGLAKLTLPLDLGD